MVFYAAELSSVTVIKANFPHTPTALSLSLLLSLLYPFNSKVKQTGKSKQFSTRSRLSEGGKITKKKKREKKKEKNH